MRIALVNDLPMAIEALRRVVATRPEHQVVWTAAHGAEAVLRCAEDTPDLILMDLIMPGMDGVEATRRIMAKTPCAIVVVTADVGGNSPKVFETMGAGALDAVNTPVLEHPNAADGARALLAKIETIRKLIGARRGGRPPGAGRREIRPPEHRQGPLVAIGASAGGPTALARILSMLDPGFPAPVVIVQHVDAQFAQGLASWLDRQSALKVRLARADDRPEAGLVLLAGQDSHLVFAGPARLAYTAAPSDCPYRPSIDVFLRSAYQFWPGDIIAVLLTGMGRDGAEGLRTLNRHGHYTIAQDRATSAVYGMPGAAADLRAATEILALDKIAPRLANIAARMVRTHA